MSSIPPPRPPPLLLLLLLLLLLPLIELWKYHASSGLPLPLPLLLLLLLLLLLPSPLSHVGNIWVIAQHRMLATSFLSNTFSATASSSLEARL